MAVVSPRRLSIAVMSGGIFILPGGCFIKRGMAGRSTAKWIKQYLALVINQQMRNIDNIASQLNGRGTQKVMNERQEVIEIGFLPGFKIDRNYRILEYTRVSTQEAPAEKQLQFKITFNCNACVANNLLYRQTAPTGKVVIEECEYCGTGASVALV